MRTGKVTSFFTLRPALLMCMAAALAGGGLGWIGREFLPTVGGHAETSSAAAGGYSAGGDHSDQRPAIPGSTTHVPSALDREAEALSARLAKEKGPLYWLRLLGAAEKATGPMIAKLTDSLSGEPAALRLLGTRWAQLDAPGMLTALGTEAANHRTSVTGNPRHADCVELQKILAGEWFRENPEAVIKALGAEDPNNGLLPAKREVLSRLAGINPGRAVELSIAWHAPITTEDLTVFKTWAGAHAEKALELLTGTEDYYPSIGAAAAEMILNEASKVLAKGNPGGLLDRLTKSREGNGFYFAQRMVKEWAGRDLAAAVAWFSEEGRNFVSRTEMTTPLLEVWGKTDPAAALDWAEHHMTGGYKKEAVVALVQTIAGQDPAKAVDFINQLDPGRAQDDAMRKLTNLSVKGKDKAAALTAFQWMMAMPDSRMRNIAMDSGARDIIDAAPTEVMEYLNSSAGTDAPLSLLSQAARVMSHDHPSEAMEWAASQRPDAVSNIRQSVLNSWFYRDPAGAGDWVRNLPTGAERADFVGTILKTVAERQGADGVRVWAETLPESDHAAIRQALKDSWRLDPAAQASLLEKYK